MICEKTTESGQFTESEGCRVCCSISLLTTDRIRQVVWRRSGFPLLYLEHEVRDTSAHIFVYV